MDKILAIFLQSIIQTMIVSFLQMLVEQRMAVKIRRHTLFPRDTISVHNCLLMSEIFII